jgi:hypothetical protein
MKLGRRQGRVLAAALLCGAILAGPAWARPPADETVLPASDEAAAALAAAAPAGAPIVVHVSPQGHDDGAGSSAAPFRTIERALQAMRQLSGSHDLVLELADGIYRLDSPLFLGTADGGRNGHKVLWTAAAGARPIISGALRVTGWKLADRARDLWVADVPKGLESRDLFVDGKLAERARIELARGDVKFTQQGLTLLNPSLSYLAELPQQGRIELLGLGYFTARYSPVERIREMRIAMKQPGWNNNIWGYDTIPNPPQPDHARLYLVNALAFVRGPDQWYLDPDQGKLYYRPRAGVDPRKADVELPRLPLLLSISGSYEPVADLSFKGLRFAHTSWLGPLEPTGYANQQSGSYLSDESPVYPKNSLGSCKFGCPQFETMRNEWSQIPAAVQVSRATRVSFENNVFAHLGQIGLGIGNDPGANESGIGLGVTDTRVSANLFTDLGGGAIAVGGVRRDAHHPSDPALANRNIAIANNRIASVSKVFMDNCAVLSTYVDSARIVHNEISDTPYDAICTGLGWGIQDVGGNPRYRRDMHLYDHKANIAYQVPTTLRNTLVAGNRIRDVKKQFWDGGAIYNLSANPGTEIRDNYISEIHGRIALYLDEGSRGIVLANNVVDGDGRWLNNNTVKSAYPMRISIDNRAVGNWHNSDKIGGRWNVYQNNLILADHLVQGDAWPAEARHVMDRAGIEPGVEIPAP